MEGVFPNSLDAHGPIPTRQAHHDGHCILHNITLKFGEVETGAPGNDVMRLLREVVMRCRRLSSGLLVTMRPEVMFMPLLIMAKESLAGIIFGTTLLAVATAKLTNFK